MLISFKFSPPFAFGGFISSWLFSYLLNLLILKLPSRLFTLLVLPHCGYLLKGGPSMTVLWVTPLQN